KGPRGDSSAFLPDLCGTRALFVVVMVSELLVFVLVVADIGLTLAALPDLALLSLYVQLLTLSAAAVLCIARPRLSRLSSAQGAAQSYLLVLLVLGLVCEAAWWALSPVPGEVSLINLSHAQFFGRTLVVGAIVSALILRYFHVQARWERQVAAEARARLGALQARIRPHFFFNCMNTIASLTRSNPRAAERAVEDLADLFRASLKEGPGLVTVADEFELAARYLDIEALRLGDRLRLSWDVAALPRASVLPQFTLQPLLENAILHGIEPLPAGGAIAILGRRDRSGCLAIEVHNPRDPAFTRTEGHQLAQENVRQRLEACFGSRGRLTIQETPTSYRVTVHFPSMSREALG
ncbi:MAG: hypothetical protein RL434_721, partial [Pseudomonadota bacterium]